MDDTSKDTHEAVASGTEEQMASAQVGVGTPPGHPPSSGTGPHTHAEGGPAGGRVDAERSVMGLGDPIAGDVATGEPVENVGSPEGDLPEQAVAEFPGDDPREQPGIFDRDRPET